MTHHRTSPILGPGQLGPSTDYLKAYNDPVIFRDDRVLRTLLCKESMYIPANRSYLVSGASSKLGRAPTSLMPFSSEIKPKMRKDVADWMLEVCLEEKSHPEVFCLAMNYLDRFLFVCPVSRSQLQLLGAVCLMVAWKVRQHQPLPAARLAEYSDFHLTLSDITVSPRRRMLLNRYFFKKPKNYQFLDT